MSLFQYLGHLKSSENAKPESTKPGTRKTKNNLKCSAFHLVSNKGFLKCKKSSDGPVVLVLGHDFKSRINRYPLTIGFSKEIFCML